MGVILKGILFLLRRGPEIYETGKLLRQSLAPPPALTEGSPGGESPAAGRVEAIEEELRRSVEERRQLSETVELLEKEVAALRAALERTNAGVRIARILLGAFVASVLVLGALVLARLP